MSYGGKKVLISVSWDNPSYVRIFYADNNSVFCNQIPLPWERQVFSRFIWQGLLYPWAFHTQMLHQIVSIPRGTYMLLISSRCSQMTQKVIKGTCPGIVMWPLHLCCHIPSSSGGCFLIEVTVGEVFAVTAKLQQWLRICGGGLVVVC